MRVAVLESSFVVPSEDTPKHSLWLSNLDINVGVSHTPTLYVYRSNGDPDFFSVERLKTALSKALVPYYPLAGRLGLDQNGRIQIECTADGVLFLVARCDSSIDGFGDFTPSSEMRHTLVPPMDCTEPPGICILLMIQVTFFSCGGVTLGIAANHKPCDGNGYLNLTNLWSQFARGENTSLPPALLPNLDRSLLRARTPPIISFNHNPEYRPNTLTPAPEPPFSTIHLKLSSNEIALLKNQSRFSTFQAIVGHAWRSICIARELLPNQETRLYFFVNVRGRLNPPLPRELLANARCTTSAVATVGDLMSSDYVAAKKIQEAIAQVNDEYVRSVIDFLEVHKSEGKFVLPRTDVIANSWGGMSLYEADFGWGKPEFVTRAMIRLPGYVQVLPSPVNDGGVYSMVALEDEKKDKFKKVFYEELNMLRLRNNGQYKFG